MPWLCFLLLAQLAPAGENGMPRAWILRDSPPTLVVFDDVGRKVLATLGVERETAAAPPAAEAALESLLASGAFDTILRAGTTLESDFAARDGSRLHLGSGGRLYTFDLTAGKVHPGGEVGCALWSRRAVTRDERRAFLQCPETDVKKPKRHVPASLAALDLDAGTRLAQRELPEAPVAMALSEGDAGLVLVFSPGDATQKKGARPPARIEVLDLDTLATRSSLTLPGPAAQVLWSESGARAYVLDAGREDKDPAKAVPGHVYVVDTSAPAVSADLELGPSPGPLSWDPVREAFYVLTAPRKGKQGAAIYVIAGERVVAERPLPRRPLSVVPAPDRSRYYVLDEGGVTLLDAELTQVVGSIQTPKPRSLVLLGGSGPRALVTHVGQERVSVVDVQEGKTLASVGTGRTGVKLLQSAAAGFATAVAGAVAQGQLPASVIAGSGIYPGQVVTVPQGDTTAAVTADGSTACVYNSQTDDVTVIDLVAGKAGAKFKGGDAGVQPALDGRTCVAFGRRNQIVVVDPETRQPRPPIEVPGVGRGLFGGMPHAMCPDGRHVYVWGLETGENVRVDLEAGALETLPGVVGRVQFR
jgi:hypothetical protein